VTCRLQDGTSPPGNHRRQMTQPAHLRLLITRLHGRRGSRAAECRVIPPCPCYRCVDLPATRACVACVWPRAFNWDEGRGRRIRVRFSRNVVSSCEPPECQRPGSGEARTAQRGHARRTDGRSGDMQKRKQCLMVGGLDGRYRI
jgi:hypothetical protein